ncbi:hypothetical protein GGF31_007141 [Allomyces arbusculus]|nr:hypothetical protein GGF31_007141 [Allomyces arbusculus]
MPPTTNAPPPPPTSPSSSSSRSSIAQKRALPRDFFARAPRTTLSSSQPHAHSHSHYHHHNARHRSEHHDPIDHGDTRAAGTERHNKRHRSSDSTKPPSSAPPPPPVTATSGYWPDPSVRPTSLSITTRSNISSSSRRRSGSGSASNDAPPPPPADLWGFGADSGDAGDALERAASLAVDDSEILDALGALGQAEWLEAIQGGSAVVVTPEVLMSGDGGEGDVAMQEGQEQRQEREAQQQQQQSRSRREHAGDADASMAALDLPDEAVDPPPAGGANRNGPAPAPPTTTTRAAHDPPLATQSTHPPAATTTDDDPMAGTVAPPVTNALDLDPFGPDAPPPLDLATCLAETEQLNARLTALGDRLTATLAKFGARLSANNDLFRTQRAMLEASRAAERARQVALQRAAQQKVGEIKAVSSVPGASGAGAVGK